MERDRPVRSIFQRNQVLPSVGTALKLHKPTLRYIQIHIIKNKILKKKLDML